MCFWVSFDMTKGTHHWSLSSGVISEGDCMKLGFRGLCGAGTGIFSEMTSILSKTLASSGL